MNFPKDNFMVFANEFNNTLNIIFPFIYCLNFFTRFCFLVCINLSDLSIPSFIVDNFFIFSVWHKESADRLPTYSSCFYRQLNSNLFSGLF
jgi:hypothetical protein